MEKSLELRSLEDFQAVKSACWFFGVFYVAYIPKDHDNPIELIAEDDCWMVIYPDDYPQLEGYELLSHYSDNLGYFGRDFSSLEEAINGYNDIYKKLVNLLK